MKPCSSANYSVNQCLKDTDAFLFDVFGTVVNWQESVVKELSSREQPNESVDWLTFANEWRKGYMDMTHHIAGGGKGPSSVDEMHRQILNSMLQSPRWSFLDSFWTEEDKKHINLVWHRLYGWPDASQGLEALKQHAFVASLSNGNVRLQVDLARFSRLPWDMIFSTELFDTFKPNPKAYLSAVRHLSLPPERCTMVAAHLSDLLAAAKTGMKTAYVRRSTEDVGVEVKSKAEGGDVDIVVGSFNELAALTGNAKQ